MILIVKREKESHAPVLLLSFLNPPWLGSDCGWREAERRFFTHSANISILTLASVPSSLT